MTNKTPYKATEIANTVVGTAAVMGIAASIFGGMNKMFGLNNEISTKKLAKDMMSGAVEGILDHFEYKLEEQDRELKRLKTENVELMAEKEKLQDEIDKLKTKKK